MCSDMVHILLPANNTVSAFTRKHSPGGDTMHIHIVNSWVQLTIHLSTPRGWMAELAMLADIQCTVYPKDDIHQLHVMAQDRESSPVIDQHSKQLCYAVTFCSIVHYSTNTFDMSHIHHSISDRATMLQHKHYTTVQLSINKSQTISQCKSHEVTHITLIILTFSQSYKCITNMT